MKNGEGDSRVGASLTFREDRELFLIPTTVFAGGNGRTYSVVLVFSLGGQPPAGLGVPIMRVWTIHVFIDGEMTAVAMAAEANLGKQEKVPLEASKAAFREIANNLATEIVARWLKERTSPELEAAAKAEADAALAKAAKGNGV